MVVCANVRLDPSEFALAEVLERRPRVRIELERVVPTDGGPSPFAWVEGDDREWITAAVHRDAAVERVEVVGGAEDGQLLRIDWRPEAIPFLRVVTETAVACLDAVGRAEGWSFHLRYPSHETFSEWCHRCAERDIDVVVESVRNSGRPKRHGAGTALTEAQREALTVALAEGYFSIPRQTTLQALSDRLEISDTATSQRIRRGVRRVLSQTL